MNTKSNKPNDIKSAFDTLFNQLSDQDKLDNEAKLLMFRFLDIVDRKRENLGWTRKELAEKVGTSASYITQLYRGDKLVNMTMLAKFQQVLELNFNVSNNEAYDEQIKKYLPFTDDKGFWVYRAFDKPDYNTIEDIPMYEESSEFIA